MCVGWHALLCDARCPPGKEPSPPRRQKTRGKNKKGKNQKESNNNSKKRLRGGGGKWQTRGALCVHRGRNAIAMRGHDRPPPPLPRASRKGATDFAVVSALL